MTDEFFKESKMPTDELDEIERERLIHLEDVEKPEEWRPGTGGCYEVLDRTSMFLDMIGIYILEHPAIVINKDWYTRAWKIHEAMCELYRDIGNAQD